MIVTGDKTHYVADSLGEGVRYTFRVRAMTRINWGPAIEGNITTGPQHGEPPAVAPFVHFCL